MASAAPTGGPVTPAQTEFAAIASKHAGATLRAVPGSPELISIPNFPLPDGWNKKITSIHFMVPTGYPYAQPDCFWADADLRLEGGQMPTNTGLQALAGVGNTLWFSWHLGRPWKPGRDTLAAWVSVIADRFASRS